MKKVFLFLTLMTAFSTAFSQKKFTISGTITDKSTGETLIGATVRIKELPQSGTTTNNYGFYSLSAPQGSYTLLISYTGYETATHPESLNHNHTVNVAIGQQNALNEVVISANRPNNDQIVSPQMGVEKLNMSQINSVPVLLGERDILKTISLLPGIKAAGEGNTGFYVRGGAADQNLILLDEATVYNASHLLGFFSTFNSDAIKDVTVYKGGMPAEYGGRLSSVLDVKMNDGNSKDYTVQGGIGLIASRVKIEGPVGDKGSFMISARRTYADLLLNARGSRDSSSAKTTLNFYDLNAKFNYHFNDKNAIYISAYLGNDNLGFQNTFGTNWGNTTTTLRFNHIFSDKLFSNTSLIYSNYSYTAQNFTTDDNYKSTSQITDLSLKEDLQYSLSDKHTLKFGFSVIHHDIAPGNITSTGTSSINDQNVEQRYGYENAAYVSDTWKAAPKLTFEYGLRLTDMMLIGPGTFSSYDAAGNTVSSTAYGSGSVVKNYVNPEPRFSASYQLNESSSIKASYNRNTQNIHLLNNSTTSTPTALYVMSDNNIKPEIADQVSAGWFKNFKENMFEFSAEVYYKKLQNQIDYKNGAQLITNQDVESQLTYGSGRAYGLELFLKKKYGRFNGWIGYTLSRTEDKFADINNGNYFPATQDRTHDLSVVGIYKISNRWSFSGTFIYSTGNAVSFPTGKYEVNGLTTFSYSERNGYREPANNRLDVAFTLEGKEHKTYHSSWTFGVYNVYGHADPYTITFRNSETVPGTTEAVQTSLFPFPVPSVTWNFKF